LGSPFSSIQGAFPWPPVALGTRGPPPSPSGGLLAVLCSSPIPFVIVLPLRLPYQQSWTRRNRQRFRSGNAGKCTPRPPGPMHPPIGLRCYAVRRYALPDKLRDAKPTTIRPGKLIVLKGWGRIDLPQFDLEARPLRPFRSGFSLCSGFHPLGSGTGMQFCPWRQHPRGSVQSLSKSRHQKGTQLYLLVELVPCRFGTSVKGRR
jgi:hypothetical protein